MYHHYYYCSYLSSDTVTRSGIFCTLYNAIQQMKTEQQVNIYEILTTMRMQKPGLVVTPVSISIKILHSLFLTGTLQDDIRPPSHFLDRF